MLLKCALLDFDIAFLHHHLSVDGLILVVDGILHNIVPLISLSRGLSAEQKLLIHRLVADLDHNI